MARVSVWLMAFMTGLAVACGGGDGDPPRTPSPRLDDATPAATGEVTPAPTHDPADGGPELAGKIAFVSFRDGDREIYVINPDGSGERSLTNHPADDFDPDFSPDGSRIVFISAREGRPHLFIMDADGGNVMQLTTDATGGLNPRWSNGGEEIVYTRGGDLAIIDAEGGEPLVIMEAQPAATAAPCRTGAFPGGWSPDDSRITYYSADITGQSGEVCTIAADGSDIEVLVSEPAGYHVEPVWSRDGRYIAYRSIRDGVHEVWVLDLETGENVNLTNSPDLDVEPYWSPDGEWLAMGVLAQGEPNFDIYIVRKDGSDLRRLTDDPAKDSYPIWGP